VIGVLPLIGCSYLVVVTDRKKVGSLFGKHDIFVIQKAEAVPISSEAFSEVLCRWMDEYLIFFRKAVINNT
jgi:hypothetical protein